MAGSWKQWAEQRWDERQPPITPPSPPAPPVGSVQPGPQSKAVSTAVLAAAVLGCVMAMQSTSLMNGTGNLWFGAVIACGAGVAAWVMRALVPSTVRVLAVLAAVLALANVLYMEHQMNEKRQEISEIFE